MATRFVSLTCLLCLVLASCSEKGTNDKNETPQPPMPTPADAGLIVEDISPAPTMGTHLDGVSNYRPRNSATPRGSTPSVTNQGALIELTLRSTPPGATASIDGQVIGITPTFWSGKAGHKSHEYTFVKPGYSMARYRFVATQNGVIHATLSLLKQSDENNLQTK